MKGFLLGQWYDNQLHVKDPSQEAGVYITVYACLPVGKMGGQTEPVMLRGP